jgi:hypothetical protein
MANRWAPSILNRAFAGAAADAIVLSTDTLKLALMTTAYSPAADLTAVNVYGDISASEASGTGYVAGGISLTSPAMSTIYANTFGRVWTVATVYALGDVVRPITTNTHLYMCAAAGTSHATTEPTWNTVSGKDNASTDNGVVWTEIGTSLTKFSSSNIVSPSMSLTSVQYGWIYDNTTTNKDLFCLLDFGSQKTWTSTVVTFTPDTNLGWVYLTPS